MNYKYIKIEACVRYWGNAEINGVSDESGRNVPFKDGDLWCPIIDVKSGLVLDWPKGVSAKFNFKVCDSGSYHLLDDSKNVISSIYEDYVPDGLCHGSEGYGDYIIFNVNEDGEIEGYSESINISQWQ